MSEDKLVPVLLRSHFITDRADDGCTWTLTQRVADMLELTEKRFGPRDMTWTFCGVEFLSVGHSRTRYLGTPDLKHICIQLSMWGAEHDTRACYLLAHEVVHLLAPDRDLESSARVIEEGCATMFAEDYMQECFDRFDMTSDPRYISACALARQLVAIEPDAIRLLRGKEPSFHLMTSDTFDQAGLAHVPEELRAGLLGAFT